MNGKDMTPDALFQIANPLAFLGWIALLGYPFAPKMVEAFSGYIIPGILSLMYLTLILVHWSSAEGGFDTLANVMLLFKDPGTALAGWTHFLAFDLFLGMWAAKTARAEGIRHVFMIPSLTLTFLFGPIGFLLTLALCGLNRLRVSPQEA